MANVTLVSNALRFMTNIGMAYNCSLEADIRLEMPVQVTASENKTNEYIRLTPDMKKGLMMQAFELLNDTDYGKGWWYMLRSLYITHGYIVKYCCSATMLC